MCFLRARAGSELVDRLAQARQDVGAAARLDARDVAEDALPVRRALQPHDGLRDAVEHDDGDLIGRRQRLGGGARGVLGEVHLGRPPSSPTCRSRARARATPPRAGRGRRGGPAAAPRGACRGIRPGRSSAAARDEQPAAVPDEGVQRRRASRRAAPRAGRPRARRGRSAEGRARASPAAPAARRRDALGAERARERAPPPRATPSRQSTRGSRSVAIASTPSSFSGCRSLSALTPGVERARPGLGDPRRERDRGRARRERRASARARRRRAWSSPSSRTPGARRTVGEQADLDAERDARADVVGGGEPDDGGVARGVGAAAGARTRAGRGRAARLAVAIRSPRVGPAVGDEQQARDGGVVDQPRAEAERRARDRSRRRPGPGSERRRRAPPPRRRRLRLCLAFAFAGRDLLGARGEADDARRPDRRAPPRRAGERADRRARAPSAASETLSETSTSATTETARAGRRSVGPASATAMPAGTSARSGRLQRELTAREVGEREARARRRRAGPRAPAAASPAARTRGSRRRASRSRRPPAVEAHPLEQQRAPSRAAAPARAGGPTPRRAGGSGGASVRPPSASAARGRGVGLARVGQIRGEGLAADEVEADLARSRPRRRRSRARTVLPVVAAAAGASLSPACPPRPAERVGDEQRERGAHRQIRAARVEAGGGEAKPGPLARDDRAARRTSPRPRTSPGASASRRASAMLTSARSTCRRSGWSRRVSAITGSRTMPRSANGLPGPCGSR